MEKTLYIEGKKIELYESEVIALTFRANEIANLENLQASFSNRITIPPTKKNRKHLGSPGQINSLTEKPYTVLRARYEEEGWPIFQEGSAIIEESGDDIVLALYSGNFNLIDFLGDRTLADVDFGDLNHVWNFAGVVNNTNNASGFVYGLADYGLLAKTGNNVNTRALVPALFVRAAIEAIFADAPFSLTGDLFSDSLFDRLVITASNVTTWRTRVNTITENNGGAFLIVGYPFYDLCFVAPSVGFECNINNEYRTTTQFDPVFFLFVSFSSYVLPDDGTYEIEFFADIEVTTANGQPVQIQVGNSVFQAVTNSRTQVEGKTTFQGVANNFIFYRIIPNFSDLPTQVRVFPGTRLNIRKTESEKQYTGFWRWNETLENLKLTEFVKGVFSVFGVIPQYDEIEQRLICNKINQIPQNKAIAKNWSDKIDVSRPVSIETRLDGYAQNNNFSYQTDQAAIGTGNFSYQIKDQTLPVVANIVQLPFAASNQFAYLSNNVNVIQCSIFELDNSLPQLIKQVNTPKMRLAFAQNKDFSVSLLDGSSTQTVSNFKELRFSGDVNLSFGGGLFESYYRTFFDSGLSKVKLLKAFFKLNQFDVDEIDFFKPIYIEHISEKLSINGYFYVTIIDNYRADRLTECKLLLLR